MMRARRLALAALALCGAAAFAIGAAPVPPAGVGYDPAEAAGPGVGDMRRAWQNWTLNCQGCHRADGSGSEGAAPRLAGSVARFLRVTGGREYLGQVPGVASSPLSSADLAEVVNWMLWRFDRAHVPAPFQPYTAEEIGRLRQSPLHTEASQLRRRLLRQVDRHPGE
jgi:mono/diheme cytochrome c family protein